MQKLSRIERMAAAEIMGAVRQNNGKEAHLLGVIGNRQLLEKIAKMIVDETAFGDSFFKKRRVLELLEREFIVEVDYGLDPKEMLKACQFDAVESEELLGKHLLIKRGFGKYRAAMRLVQFAEDFTPEEAKSRLRLLQLLPAKVEEFLAFAASYPDIQREICVVTPAWRWKYRDFDTALPCLTSGKNGKERRISVGLHSGTIHRSQFVLARQKALKK